MTSASGIRSCNPSLKTISKAGHSRGFSIHLVHGQFAGLAERDDTGDVFRARAAVTLLVSPINERIHACPLADVDGADPLGSVELVPRKGEKVDVHRVDVDGDLASGLNGVGMENRPLRFRDGANLGNGLDGAGLIIPVHHADDNRIVPNGLADIFRVDHPRPTDGDVRNFDALRFQVFTGFQNSGMLNGRCHDVPTFGLVGRKNTPNGHVVGFRPATREDDLPGPAPQQRGHPLPGFLDGHPGILALGVNARGIGVTVLIIGQQGFQHLRPDRGGRVVVHIDPAQGESLPLVSALTLHYLPGPMDRQLGLMNRMTRSLHC